MTVEAPEVDFGDDDDGAAGFYENLTGKTLATDAPVESAEAVDDGDGSETPETVDAPTDPSEAPTEGDADDEGEIELSFGDDKKKVSVKDIKRLMEAETSVTTKTAAAEADRAASLVVTQRAETALKSMLDRARASFEPYSKLNFLSLAKDPNVSAEVLETVQKEAQAAYEAVQYFQTELNDVTARAAHAAAASNQKAASEAVKVLSDPTSPNHIPNFGKPVYEEIVNFAASQGVDKNAALAITDPAALKIVHMAMEFAKGQRAASVKVTKVIQKPTRVLKPSASASSAPSSQQATDAMARLRRSGSEEDAANAFMASFRNKD